MLIEYIWGAVGFATGVCFATLCLTLAIIMDDRAEDRRRKRILKRAVEQEYKLLMRFYAEEGRRE